LSPAAAQPSYVSALQRWPGDLALTMGLGNSAYALGHLDEAAQAFAQATQQHPDAADAWNNLAQVQLELGRREAALQAVDRALALGGPRRDQYLRLRQKLTPP